VTPEREERTQQQVRRRAVIATAIDLVADAQLALRVRERDPPAQPQATHAVFPHRHAGFEPERFQ